MSKDKKIAKFEQWIRKGIINLSGKTEPTSSVILIQLHPNSNEQMRFYYSDISTEYREIELGDVVNQLWWHLISRARIIDRFLYSVCLKWMNRYRIPSQDFEIRIEIWGSGIKISIIHKVPEGFETLKVLTASEFFTI